MWFALGAALAAAVPSLPAADVSFVGPTEVAQLAAPPRNETSGIAASRRTSNLFWVHDDSGGAPVLYAVGIDGALRGKLRISGVKNVDWEDIASAELDGKACLVIGDTGDNDENRKNAALQIVEEPTVEKLSPREDRATPVLATLHVIYEDGPHDCESVAIDPRERAAYLLTKRDDVPRLYRVALPTDLKSGDVRAHFVGFVGHLPQPNSMQKLIKGHLGKHRGWPTSMDFAADGSGAAVLTYGDLLWFERHAGESWADALGREPRVLPAHVMPQAEAVCFSPDNAHIFVASEISPALLRYDRK